MVSLVLSPSRMSLSSTDSSMLLPNGLVLQWLWPSMLPIACCCLTMGLLQSLQGSFWVTEVCQDKGGPSKKGDDGQGGNICWCGPFSPSVTVVRPMCSTKCHLLTV